MTAPTQAPARAPQLRVGLTGGIGSGKSAVGTLFDAKGICVIDADALAHALTAPGGAAIDVIARAFGTDAIDASGAMDRPGMRARVFADPAEKLRLEAILHPLIRTQTEQLAAAATSPYLILMIPLLVEGGNWRARVQRVLVVDCSEETQIARVMQRSRLSAKQVRAIIASQAARSVRLAAADDVIENEGALAAIAPQVDALHARYLQLARTHAGAVAPDIRG